MRLHPRLYDESRFYSPSLNNITKRLTRGWDQVSRLGCALLFRVEGNAPKALKLTPDSVSWVPFLNHATRTLIVYRLWGLKQERLSKSQEDLFDIDVELARETGHLLVRVGLFGLIYFKVGGKRPLLHAIGFDLFLSLGITASGLEGNGYNVDCPTMFTPRRSCRKITLPWFKVIVDEKGGVSWQGQTHMVPVGNLTATHFDNKVGKWLKALRQKVKVEIGKEGEEHEVRLIDLAGVSAELWPTLTEQQQRDINLANQQICPADMRTQKLGSDGIFSWMREANLSDDYKRVMHAVASEGGIRLDNEMDIVGLIEGLSPSGGRIRQVLMSQLFGGRTDVAQFVFNQLLKGGKELVRASLNKQKATDLLEQIDKVKEAITAAFQSITDEKCLQVLERGKASGENLETLIVNFVRDGVGEGIALAVKQLTPHLEQARQQLANMSEEETLELTKQTEKIQNYLHIVHGLSMENDLNQWLVTYVLPKRMLELARRQSQVVAHYKTEPFQKNTPDYVTGGGLPLGRWRVQAQERNDTSDKKTTVKTSLVKAQAYMGPVGMELQFAGGRPIDTAAQKRIGNGGPSVSFPTMQQVMNWIGGKDRDEAAAFIQGVQNAVIPRVQDLVRPMFEEVPGQVVCGQFQVKGPTGIAKGGLQVVTDSKGSVSQFEVFGAKLKLKQLKEIEKERARLERQQQLSDFVLVPRCSKNEGDTTLHQQQPQSNMTHIPSIRAAHTAERVQFLNPVGAYAAIASRNGCTDEVTCMVNSALNGIGFTLAFDSEAQCPLQDLQLKGPFFKSLAHVQQNYLNPTLKSLKEKLQPNGVKGMLELILDKLMSFTDSKEVLALLNRTQQEPKDIGTLTTEMTPVKQLADVLRAHGVDLGSGDKIEVEHIKSRFTRVNLQRCLTVLFKKYKETGKKPYLELLHLVQKAAAMSIAEKTLSIGQGAGGSHVKIPLAWTNEERNTYYKTLQKRLGKQLSSPGYDPNSVVTLFVGDKEQESRDE